MAATSGYLMQLIGPAQHKMWGYATAAFALLQATAGYLMAFIYAQTGSYRSFFVLGCAALALGAILVAFLAQNKLQKRDCISASSYCFYLDG
ncbi:YbfB/YjiJ family MFS transporter [Staphylococcus epidermidis]|nr:YbfB/YjiJ family MFS transporter [Staphylococcus epidermidis]